jgi:hypothetical protein
MVKSISRESEFLKELRQAFNDDANYQRIFQARVNQVLLDPLRAELTTLQQKRKHSVPELDKG